MAAKLLTPELRDNVHILFHITRPCWSWYTSEVQGTKSPADAVTYAVRMCDWATNEPHLRETAQALSNSVVVRAVARGSSAENVLALAWGVIANRAWSLARHDAPPESFARLASSDFEERASAMESMRLEWKWLLALEQQRHAVPAASTLWEDLATASECWACACWRPPTPPVEHQDSSRAPFPTVPRPPPTPSTGPPPCQPAR